jgi:TPR repeat protein
VSGAFRFPPRLRQRAAARAFACAASLILLGAAADQPDVGRGLADFQQGRFAEAFRDWWIANAQGDPRGALYLGVLYDTGLGVRQNYQLAMAWYRHAAEEGSAAGAFNVAVLYDAGYGVAKDPAAAADWYARAAAQGFGRAEYNLAMLYESGEGVSSDRKHAVDLYRRAAQHGIAEARVHLAALGTPWHRAPHSQQTTPMDDFQRAEQLLVSRGPGEAAQATALFRQAADKHNPLAEYDLGYSYEHALGVPPDDEQAYRWYRRAAADAKDAQLRSIAQSAALFLGRKLGKP